MFYIWIQSLHRVLLLSWRAQLEHVSSIAMENSLENIRDCIKLKDSKETKRQVEQEID